MLFEQYLSKISGLTLVLCGSIASFMVKKVVRSRALYGRIELSLHLEPFKTKRGFKIFTSTRLERLFGGLLDLWRNTHIFKLCKQ